MPTFIHIRATHWATAGLPVTRRRGTEAEQLNNDLHVLTLHVDAHYVPLYIRNFYFPPLALFYDCMNFRAAHGADMLVGFFFLSVSYRWFVGHH